ncbi:MAG: hypothetical protein GY756_13570, partial [bacterium]|nr:hypothetical protein [bacterium]
MKKVFYLFIALLFSSVIFAENIIIDYIEGYADIKNDGNWEEIFIGDELALSAIIKLDEDSLIEFQYNNSTYTLNRQGVYELQKLINNSAQMDDTGVTGILSGKIGKMIFNTGTTGDEVGGVRASEAVNEPAIDWMSSESEEYIQS